MGYRDHRQAHQRLLGRALATTPATASNGPVMETRVTMYKLVYGRLLRHGLLGSLADPTARLGGVFAELLTTLALAVKQGSVPSLGKCAE